MESSKIKEARKVGPGLLLGIALVPIVFVWFLLRSGYTTVARVSGFVWLALSIALAAMVDDVPSRSESTVEAPGDTKSERAKASKVPVVLPGAVQPMDRKGYPKAYASWGGSGFEAINALLEPGAELVARSADCEAVETISLSDKRSDPKTRKIVFFADCIAADWSYTRFYVTDTQIRSGEIPVSEKSRAAAAPRDQLTAACYTALRSRMKYPSAFDPSGLRTEVAVFQSDSASAEVRTSFEAKNDLGAVLPHLGVCSLHGKKEPALFDLYADPKAWPDGREISAAARAQHAEHLAAFAGAITGADVQFASATYAQGCQAWLRRPGAVQEHTRAVMSHFQIA